MRARLALTILSGALVLMSQGAPIAAPGDGGYKLVPDWAKLPPGWHFGPDRKFLPPGEREADQAAKRKAGEVDMFESQPGISGIATDGQDRVYVLQRRADAPIVVFDSSGKYLYSGGGDIFAHDSHFVEVDRDGHVWAVDRENQRIIEYNNTLDKILMVLGTKGVPACDPTHFNRPTDVGFLSNGDLLITDGYVNNRVVKYAKNGTFIKMWGACGLDGAGDGDGQFKLPHGVRVDKSDTIYIVDRENMRISLFDKDGAFRRHIKLSGHPWGLALSPDEQFLFVVDHDTETVAKVSVVDGQVVARFGGGKGWGPGQFDWAHSIAVDSKGAVYVADTFGQRVQKFVPNSTGSNR